MSRRTLGGEPLTPGHNVDKVDVAAGAAELALCGYNDPNTKTLINYCLLRWARGEEAQADKMAIDRSFYGIDFTSWRRVLAAAIAAASNEEEE